MKNLLLFFLLATAAGWAQPRMAHEGPRVEGMAKRLNLTDAQQKQFEKLRSDLQRNQVALRSRMQTLRLDARDAFREEKPDRGKIEGKLGEISKIQNEMKLNHVAFWFDVNRILTPEQQTTWKEHRGMEGRGSGRGSMRGRMGMGGGPCPCCE